MLPPLARIDRDDRSTEEVDDEERDELSQVRPTTRNMVVGSGRVGKRSPWFPEPAWAKYLDLCFRMMRTKMEDVFPRA